MAERNGSKRGRKYKIKCDLCYEFILIRFLFQNDKLQQPEIKDGVTIRFY